MNITFLGTAAGSSYPLAFCKCENCRQARVSGGKNLRKRSSIIVNDDLLIDMGQDTVFAAHMYNKPLADINVWLQTHAHSDHFDPQHLCTRTPEFKGVDTPGLQLFASGGSINRMSKMLSDEGYVKNIVDRDEQLRLNLQISTVTAYERFNVNDYEITALPASHDPAVEPLIFMIERAGKTLLYAVDTDSLVKGVWEYFVNSKTKFDAVIMDHTYGINANGSGHLNAERFFEHATKLRRLGLLSPTTKMFATHISHEGNPLHDILSGYAQKRNYEIAYDGLSVKI